MKLSNEFLSLQFKKAAAEYVSLGLYREAELAENHAKDVRRLSAPRVLYINGDELFMFHVSSPHGYSCGPFEDFETAMNTAWRQIVSEPMHRRPYAAVYLPPKKPMAQAAE